MIKRIDFDDRKYYYDSECIKDVDGLERYRGMITEDLFKEKSTFFTLALHLREFYENGSYGVLFAEAKEANASCSSLGYLSAPVFFYACNKLFKLGKTTVKQLMRIPEEYAEDESGLSPRWENYTFSQLVEMLPLSPVQREAVSSDWTIKQIREYRKSFEPVKEAKSQTSDLTVEKLDVDKVIARLDDVGSRAIGQCNYKKGTVSYNVYKKAVDDFIALMKKNLMQSD